MKKILHQVLKEGDIIKSKKGHHDWIVLGHNALDEVLLGCIHTYRRVPTDQLQDWELLEDCDLHKA